MMPSTHRTRRERERERRERQQTESAVFSKTARRVRNRYWFDITLEGKKSQISHSACKTVNAVVSKRRMQHRQGRDPWPKSKVEGGGGACVTVQNSKQVLKIHSQRASTKFPSGREEKPEYTDGVTSGTAHMQTSSAACICWNNQMHALPRVENQIFQKKESPTQNVTEVKTKIKNHHHSICNWSASLANGAVT